MKKTILILSVLFFLSCKKESMYNIPNVISPNGDGINDTWVIPFDNADVLIFNRAGATVYHSSNYQQDFAGLGYTEPYYYVITFGGNKERGTLTVIL